MIFDPMLFSDDDKLSLYYHVAGTLVGARINSIFSPRLKGLPRESTSVRTNQGGKPYDEYNEFSRRSFMEGAWMINDNGAYYLTYIGPGTALGACKETSPLGEFVERHKNPVLREPGGVVPKCGHGSIVGGPPNGTHWAFDTIVVRTDTPERRPCIGSDSSPPRFQTLAATSLPLRGGEGVP